MARQQSLEQLWHTSSRSGLPGRPGFRVRAASSGLLMRGNADLVQCFGRAIAYELPARAGAVAVTPAQAPVGLLWTDIAGRRVLARRVYAGVDYSGRPGNTFAHVIVGAPREVTALTAARCWAAPFWRGSDSDLAPDQTELPALALEQLNVGEDPVWDRARLAEADLAWAIQAYLSAAEDGRIFIADIAEGVAALVWAIARSLPPALTTNLTFSTYERQPTRCEERIVGTCLTSAPIAERPAAVLPPQCFGRPYAALDRYAGRRTVLPDSASGQFAAFAARCLATGDTAPLDSLLRVADELKVESLDAFLRVFDLLLDPRPLDREARLAILRLPVAPIYLQVAPLRARLFATLQTDPAWWRRDAAAAIKQLGEAGRAILINAAFEHLASVLRAGELAVAQGLLEIVANPPLGVGLKARWADLLATLGEEAEGQPYTALPWDSNIWLLRATYGLFGDDPPRGVRPWLVPPWDHVRRFMAAAPGAWRMRGLEMLVRGGIAPPPDRGEALLRDLSTQVKAVIHGLAVGSEREDVLHFLRSLARARIPIPMPVLDATLAGATSDPGFGVRVFYACRSEEGAIRAEAILEPSIERLILSSGSSSIAPVVRKCLEATTQEECANPYAAPLFEEIARRLRGAPGLPGWLADLADGWAALAALAASEGLPMRQAMELAQRLSGLDPSIGHALRRQTCQLAAMRMRGIQDVALVLDVLGRPLAGSGDLLLIWLLDAAAMRFDNGEAPPAWALAVIKFAVIYPADAVETRLRALVAKIPGAAVSLIEAAVKSWDPAEQAGWDRCVNMVRTMGT